MFVGLMNNPRSPLEVELRRIAEFGCDFVDLTLEPPGAWPVNVTRIRSLLDQYGLSAIGHTAYYLPIGSAFDEIRQAAVETMRTCLHTFHDLGIPIMNIHPHWESAIQGIDQPGIRNAQSITALAEYADQLGMRIMIENNDFKFADVADLRPLFAGLPQVGFHLDVGHANLGKPSTLPIRTRALLAAFGDRLTHVHVHDNNGGRDDAHLPLGAGSIDWQQAVLDLKGVGWDGTVTLEVFTDVAPYLVTSIDLWRRLWSSEQL